MVASTRGRFIAFEGLDGAGLSTQARMLHERFAEMRVPCNRSAEPTQGPIGSLLKQWLAHRVDFDNRTVALLFAADRCDHLFNPVSGVQSRLSEGISEISERYVFSSLAYQSLDEDMNWIMKINQNIIMPDVVVFLEIAPGKSCERINRRQTTDEVYESLGTLEKVAVNFLVALEKFGKKATILRIDAARDPATVANDVWSGICRIAPLSDNGVLPLWNRMPSRSGDKG